MKMDIVNKARMIAESLKALDIKGISFFGSLGSEHIDKYSDVDIVVFCDKIPDAGKRKKILDKFTKEMMVNRDRWTQFKIDGKEIVIHFKKISEIERALRLFSKKISWFEKDIDTLVYNTRIVYDPKILLRKWKYEVRRYPEWLKKEKLEQIRFAGSVFEEVFKCLARNNRIWLDFSINYKIDYNIMQVLYALNERYFSASKWFYTDAKKFKVLPKDCLKRINHIYSLNNGSQLVEKMRLINDLIFDTFEICKKEIPSMKEPTRDRDWCNKKIKEIERFM